MYLLRNWVARYLLIFWQIGKWSPRRRADNQIRSLISICVGLSSVGCTIDRVRVDTSTSIPMTSHPVLLNEPELVRWHISHTVTLTITRQMMCKWRDVQMTSNPHTSNDTPHTWSHMSLTSCFHGGAAAGETANNHSDIVYNGKLTSVHFYGYFVIKNVINLSSFEFEEIGTACPHQLLVLSITDPYYFHSLAC